MPLKWIETNGGPFLMLPKSSLKNWEGVRSPSDGRIVRANFRFEYPGAPATDYDRACDVEDEIEKIKVQSADGIVVGGEPLPVAWITDSSDFQNLLLRVCYSDASSQIEPVIQSVSDTDFEKNFDINITEKNWIIFDSAEPGDEIVGDFLNIILVPGKYSIETAYVSPNSNNSFIIHRFIRIC